MVSSGWRVPEADCRNLRLLLAIEIIGGMFFGGDPESLKSLDPS